MLCHVEDSARRKKIDDSLVKMLALDMQPALIVEDSGFRAFINVLDPRYVPPSRRSIMREHLPQLYASTKGKLMDELAKIEWCSLSTDLWTSRAAEGYLTLTCHYITCEWQLRSIVLETTNVSVRHTSENLASVLLGITNEWKISDKVTCVITDNASNIVGAVRINKWKHIPCFAHT